jgi:hypothetical protein
MSQGRKREFKAAITIGSNLFRTLKIDRAVDYETRYFDCQSEAKSDNAAMKIGDQPG